MGSVHPYTLKSGAKRYLVSYRGADNRQVMKRGFVRKKDAEDFEASVTVAKRDGVLVAPSKGRRTVDDVGEAWLKSQKPVMKPSAWRSLESAWRVHVRPKWGRRAVGGIEQDEVQDWVSDLAAKKSATTVLRAHGVLVAILDRAKLPVNKARGVTLPRKTDKPRVYLTHAQVTRLAEESTQPDLVYFLAYTGLRWGEATGLRVKHVDVERRRVTVEENAVMVNGEVIVGTPKTHERRSVPYPRFLAPVMEARTKDRSRDALVFHMGARHMNLPNSQNGWLQAAVDRLQAADVKAAEERGDVDCDVFPRVTPHDFRHTAASLAISAGANVKAVQRMLGHKTAAMTLDTYGALFEDDLDDVADALDRARLL